MPARASRSYPPEDRRGPTHVTAELGSAEPVSDVFCDSTSSEPKRGVALHASAADMSASSSSWLCCARGSSPSPRSSSFSLSLPYVELALRRALADAVDAWDARALHANGVEPVLDASGERVDLRSELGQLVQLRLHPLDSVLDNALKLIQPRLDGEVLACKFLEPRLDEDALPSNLRRDALDALRLDPARLQGPFEAFPERRDLCGLYLSLWA